jgi:hypothetical protein
MWSNDWRKMNWKGFERERLCPNGNTVPAFAWGTDQNHVKHLKACATVEIRTEHFPCRGLEL